MHIDLNAFFVRAEEIKNPSLVGKPVGIGHLGRGGIISTCSYAARNFGVRSGMPTFQAVKLCPHIILLDGDYHYYSALSVSFYQFLKRRFKLVERTSVDECYVDLTDYLKGMRTNEVQNYLKTMQDDLFKELGLNSSIGIGPTRFLAKMGSDLKKPMGISILRVRDIDEKLGKLKIENMYMVGKKTAPRLKILGIYTIADFKRELLEEDPIIKRETGKAYAMYREWLSGRGDDEISVEPWDPKSISHATTLMNDTDDVDVLKEVLKDLIAEVSKDAIHDKKKGSVIQISLKTTDFKTKNKQKKFTRSTNDPEEMFVRAVPILNDLMDEIVAKDMKVRLIGVALNKLINPKDEMIQMTFYDYQIYEEEMRSRLIINEINRKMKKDVLKFASELKKERKK